MRVYPKAIVFTTKPHSDVRECIESLRGLVVRTITLGKTRIRAIVFDFIKIVNKYAQNFETTKKLTALF